MSETPRSVDAPQSPVQAVGGWSVLHVVIAAALTSVAYLLGTKLGLALTFRSDAAAILWPPNAFLLAALLLSPVRIWWILLLAVLPPHLAVELKGGVPATMAIAWYVSNCLEALIGAAIFRAWVARGHETDTVRSFGVFMLGATFFATFVSSFLDAGFVSLIGWKADPYWDVWRQRFFSNMLATQT
ncbi:MAG TPA: MASE1 domain-containing protein, partial [Gemmatimonadaceae bacterium]